MSNYKQKQAELAAQNPFYGKKELLVLSQSLSKGVLTPSQINNLLTTAWDESKKDKTLREMFFTVVFACGDVSNREHNIFRKEGVKNPDKGGSASRKNFIYCLQWLYKNVPEQYFKFLSIIPEYTNYENVLYYQLRTDRIKGRITENVSIGTDAKFIDEVTTYLASKISSPKTNAMEHQLIAKFLRKPRFSSRKKVSKKGIVGRRKLKPETIAKELFEFKVAEALSKKLGWEIKTFDANTRFVGLEGYKAAHNRTSEAYLFSSKQILNYDEPMFHEWLNTLPSGARYNVQRRLLDGKGKSKNKWIGKYGDLASFYDNWVLAKDMAASKVRELEKKASVQENLSDEDKLELAKAKKESKMNTGAITITDMLVEAMQNRGKAKELDVIMDNLLRKINIDVPVLTIVDVSGSMSSRYANIKGVRISAKAMAELAATVMLLKNPDPELSNILIKFDSKCEIMVQGEEIPATTRRNRFTSSATKTVSTLVDKAKPFSENLTNIASLLNGGGSTDLSTLTRRLKEWTEEDPSQTTQRKEMILKYPVFLVISDGDLNSYGGAESSLKKVQMEMRQWFGWEGVIVVWDVKETETGAKFDNMENIIYYPFTNPQVIDQIFSKIDDIDVIDIYTSLKGLYQSNRYQPVRSLTI